MWSIPPLGWAVYSLALVSILFEPCRLALWRLGDSVGGVGGVGGLTGQFSPASCNKTGDEVPYCFHAGWFGFTPFGAAMLCLCTLPLGLAALA